MNYDTKWMTPDAIVDATYASGLGLNATKKRMGLISAEVAERTETRIVAAQEMLKKIDSIVGKRTATDGDMEALREAASALNESTVCEKGELDCSEDSIYSSIPRMVGSPLRRK